MNRTDLLLDTLAILREEWGDVPAGKVHKAEAGRLKEKFIALLDKAEKDAPKVKVSSLTATQKLRRRKTMSN